MYTLKCYCFIEGFNGDTLFQWGFNKIKGNVTSNSLKSLTNKSILSH